MTEIKEFFQNLVESDVVSQEPTNYDAATLKIYIAHLEAENAELHEKLSNSIDTEQIAKYLAEKFDCPCNFSPIDEEMFEFCEECNSDESKVCWEKVIARLKKYKGGQQ